MSRFIINNNTITKMTYKKRTTNLAIRYSTHFFPVFLLLQIQFHLYLEQHLIFTYHPIIQLQNQCHLRIIQFLLPSIFSCSRKRLSPHEILRLYSKMLTNTQKPLFLYSVLQPNLCQIY